MYIIDVPKHILYYIIKSLTISWKSNKVVIDFILQVTIRFSILRIL